MMQASMQQGFSLLAFLLCIAGARAVGVCTVKNDIYPEICIVKCSLFGVNGDVQDPGIAAAQYLSEIYPSYQFICTQKWILEIENSKFPNDTLRQNWLFSPDPIPPINELLLHTCMLQTIQMGAFSQLQLGSNVIKLAIYYNLLNSITSGMTQGLNSVESFEWVGNGELSYVDSQSVLPFRESVQVMQISDCGFANADVVANITGFCQTANLPILRSLELSFNRGPGLSVLSNKHINQATALFSLYLWNAYIEYIEDNTVFDTFAVSIQTIDLSNNLLQTMPNGTLDSIIAENKLRMSLALRGNPWKCDCNLLWLQNVIKFGLGGIIVIDQPVCATPPSEAGKLLIEADMSANCEPPLISPPVDISCL